MKKIFTALMCVMSFSCYASNGNTSQTTNSHHLTLSCPQASATTDHNFCGSFRSVAQCHCAASGLPPAVCQNVTAIYNRMISIFGSIQRACEYQRDTSVRTCIDDWNCYRFGGKDSTGGLCSSTGRACQ